MKVASAEEGPTRTPTAVPVGDEDATRRTRAEAAAPTDRTDLSRLGALLNTLHELAGRDPERYQRAVTSLSGRLDEAAAARPGGSELFEALARRFRQGAGAASQGIERGRAATGYARSGPAEPGELEDLVETSLEESAA